MTAGYLGSKGVKFASELPAQRQAADKELGELKQKQDGFEVSQFGVQMNDLIHDALRSLDDLDAKRSAASALAITHRKRLATTPKSSTDC